MKKVLISLAIGVLASTQAIAQESGWMLHARAVQEKMESNSSSGLGWSAENKSLTAVDASYFLNKNVAVELLWFPSQTHEVTGAGVSKGSFAVSPHALVLQYHLTDWARIQPYLGAGINNTQYSSSHFTSGETVDRSSWGVALQMGANFPIDKRWSLNLDIKKLYSQTDIESAGVYQGTLKLNPMVTGLGVGYRF